MANAGNGQHEAKAAVQFAIPCDEPESFALEPFHAMFQIALMTAHFLDYPGRQSLAAGQGVLAIFFLRVQNAQGPDGEMDRSVRSEKGFRNAPRIGC